MRKFKEWKLRHKLARLLGKLYRQAQFWDYYKTEGNGTQKAIEVFYEQVVASAARMRDVEFFIDFLTLRVVDHLKAMNYSNAEDTVIRRAQLTECLQLRGLLETIIKQAKREQETNQLSRN